MQQTREERLEELCRKKEEVTDEKQMWGITRQITRLRNLIVEERKLDQYRQQAESLGLTIEVKDRLWQVDHVGQLVVQYWPSSRKYLLRCRTESDTVTNFGTLLDILAGKNPYAKTKMTFGKYQGHKIEDIPLDYLQWLRDNVDLYGNIKKAVELMFVTTEFRVESHNVAICSYS